MPAVKMATGFGDEFPQFFSLLFFQHVSSSLFLSLDFPKSSVTKRSYTHTPNWFHVGQFDFVYIRHLHTWCSTRRETHKFGSSGLKSCDFQFRHTLVVSTNHLIESRAILEIDVQIEMMK